MQKLFRNRNTWKIHNFWKGCMSASKDPFGYLIASIWQYGGQHEGE